MGLIGISIDLMGLLMVLNEDIYKTRKALWIFHLIETNLFGETSPTPTWISEDTNWRLATCCNYANA